MGLSPTELSALRDIAGSDIPADDRMPGVDDSSIFADIANFVGRDLPLIRTALDEIG